MAKSLRIIAVALICLAFLTSSSARATTSCGKARVASYRGSWSSDRTGHHGLLKAKVSAQGCNTYRVRFSGTFLGVIPFVYSAPMTVTGRTSNGGTALYSRSRLPIFGDFTSYASLTGNSFVARYVSSEDQGQFVMQRR